MKKIIITALVAFLSFAAIPSFADDSARVKDCITDNKDQKQTEDVVKAYCSCMDEHMKDVKTGDSITQWEKSNTKDDEECSTKAGWKGK